MKRLFLFAAAFAILTTAFLISCGGNDDNGSGNESDDDDSPSGTCEAYCDKVISCGDSSWASADDCAAACESAPKKDCFLTCDPSATCGDFMDCLAGC